MKTLYIEGVRAFKQRIAAPLGKLTLLVGQNSTGKSTFLACARIAWDIATRGETDFNEQPFELGSYDSIAHYHGGQGKRVTHFSVGAEFPLSRPRRRDGQRDLPGVDTSAVSGSLTIEGTFRSDHGSPKLTSWKSGDGVLSVEAARRNGKVSLTLSGLDQPKTFEIEVPTDFALPLAVRMAPSFLGQTKDVQNTLAGLSRTLLHPTTQRPYALAPVRSRPLRTYDPIRDRPSPEGVHIPALLSRLQALGDHEWQALSKALKDFGTDSGLFSDLSVRSLGKSQQGDPFQIHVKIPGQQGPRNLLDVGYGISQVLPIIVESALGSKGSLLLVQQPEVHLHPQAQAVLGTYLATSAGTGAVQYVIETHSDYIVDRVAMAVRDPEHPLKASDVSILFFEFAEQGVNLHNLKLSEGGQLLDPPDGYRRFFLHEQARFLGVEA